MTAEAASSPPCHVQSQAALLRPTLYISRDVEVALEPKNGWDCLGGAEKGRSSATALRAGGCPI